ncbi:MAG: hypothetical protein ACK5U0_01945 [Gemmatimonas sp.]|uniref:hypothetical protein n=1 Tax=Gemmatimonas sp. TaxID=1962908 RepID=UPI00391B596E
MPLPALRLVPALLGLLCAIPAAPAGAGHAGQPQSTRLDVGSFTISVGGQRTGREQFSVQRVVTNEGGTIELRSESAVGDTRTAVRLEADSAGTPVRYSIEARRGTEQILRLGGQRVRGRFATLARSVTGEAAREYLLRPGAVVVEEDGIVQYALLVRGRMLAEGEGLTLPSLTPVANSQGAVRIVLEAAHDVVIIAGARRDARRYRIVTAAGEVRLLWAEADGALLRVSIPARGVDALRDDVPR